MKINLAIIIINILLLLLNKNFRIVNKLINDKVMKIFLTKLNLINKLTR